MHTTNLFCGKLVFWPRWKEYWIWIPSDQMTIRINCVAQTSPLSYLSFSFLLCELRMRTYPWQDCLLGLLKWWNLARVVHLTPPFSSLLRSDWHRMDLFYHSCPASSKCHLYRTESLAHLSYFPLQFRSKTLTVILFSSHCMGSKFYVSGDFTDHI